jgi:hypothetical protein
MLSEPFDIFELEGNATLLWIGTASSLEDAKKIVNDKLSIGDVPSYLIACKTNGFQLRVSRIESVWS